MYKLSYHRMAHVPTIIARLCLCLLAIALAACGADDDNGSSTSAAPTGAATATTAATETALTVTSTADTPDATATESQGTPTSTKTTNGKATAMPMDDLPTPVQTAIKMAAEEKAVPIEQVELVEYGDVEWSDSSLGCPEKDMFYAQVIVPGYLVQVEVAGETMEYHTDNSNRVIRCFTAN